MTPATSQELAPRRQTQRQDADQPAASSRALDPMDRWIQRQEHLQFEVLDDGRKMWVVDKALKQRVVPLVPTSSVIQIDPTWTPQVRTMSLEVGKDTYKVGSKKIGTKDGGGLSEAAKYLGITLEQAQDALKVSRNGDVYDEVHALDAPAYAKVAGDD